MADITSSDFAKLIKAQEETTRQLMSVEERASDDAKREEVRQKRSAAGTKSWQTRQENAGKKGGADETEDNNKKDKKDEKNLTFLKGISDGIGGILKSGRDKVATGLSAFKKFAFGALAIAAIAFLNNPKFKEITDTIIDVIVPALAYLYDNVIKPIAGYIGGKLLDLFESIKKEFEPGGDGIYGVLMDNKIVILAISAYMLGFAKIWKIIKGTMIAINFSLKLFNAEYRKQVLENIKKQIKAMAAKAWQFMKDITSGIRALAASMIKNILKPLGRMAAAAAGKVWTFMKLIPPMLLTLKVFFLSTMLPAITAMAASFAAMAIPLLPIIAIAAGIALVLASLKIAFDDFMFELEATGSIWEATKTAIVSVISNILGLPFELLKDGVSWILGAIGDTFGLESFKNAESFLDSFNIVDIIAEGITFMGNAISGLFDFIIGKVQSIIRAIPVFGDDVADALFGKPEEQAAKKKSKAQEQKTFALNRKALKAGQGAAGSMDEMMMMDGGDVLSPEPIKRGTYEYKKAKLRKGRERMIQRQERQGSTSQAPVVVNAPTNVNAPNTTNMSSSSTPMINTDRVFDKLSMVG